MSLLRVLLIFGVGFVTWFLALGRTFALVQRLNRVLYSLVFVEELITLLIGMWLAREGTLIDAVSCASGALLASVVIMRIEKWQRSQR
jgi:hypothetical protein